MRLRIIMILLLVLASFGAYAEVNSSAFKQLDAKVDCIIAHGGMHSKKVSVCFQTDTQTSKVTQVVQEKEFSYRNVGGNSFKKALKSAVRKASTKAEKEVVVGMMVHKAVYSLPNMTVENKRLLLPVMHSHFRVLTGLSTDDSIWEKWPKKFNTYAKGDKFEGMVFGNGTKTKSNVKVAIRPYRSQFTGEMTEFLPAFDIIMPDGTKVPFLLECWNLTSSREIILPVVPETKKEVSKQPVAEFENPPQQIEKKSAFYGMKVQIEDGAWLYHGATRHSDWKGGGGEAMLWVRFGKGNQYATGAGPIGSVSYGSSDNGYKWNEHYVGGQVGFRRDFWDSSHRPTGYGVKIRGVGDHVQGGNTLSGYHASQDDFLLGGYAEWLQRRGPRWLIGAQAYGYAMLGAKQQSTWSGDKPQDRSSVGANIFAEYFLHYGANETFGKWWWSIRGNLGASHQFWDNQSIAPISLQLRLGSKKWGVFGCGVQVGLPIGRSAQYVKAGVSWGDLVSLTEFCNYNYGGIVQRLDGGDRVGQVQERHDIKFSTTK